jgi:hypothetical protein
VSGSITEGKRADIIVLSDNILEIEAREIGDARVLLTVFGGRIVYRHEDFASADPGADDNRQVDRHEDPAR